MPTITPVVKNLLIINVLFFVCVYLLPMGEWLPDFKLYFPVLDRFQPYQLVTHMFMHASIGHIGFNMLSLFFLGPYVERYAGPKKFFMLYMLCGFGAILTHLAIQYMRFSATGDPGFPPVLGASGAVYGILISFAVLFPDVKLMLLIPPIPVKARYLAIGLIVYGVFSGMRSSGYTGGVAHYAHLGGAVTGALLTFFWLKPSKFRR